MKREKLRLRWLAEHRCWLIVNPEGRGFMTRFVRAQGMGW